MMSSILLHFMGFLLRFISWIFDLMPAKYKYEMVITRIEYVECNTRTLRRYT